MSPVDIEAIPPLERECSLCGIPYGTQTCNHVLDVGDGRVVMKHRSWQDLLSRIDQDDRQLESKQALINEAQDVRDLAVGRALKAAAERDEARAALAEAREVAVAR